MAPRAGSRNNHILQLTEPAYLYTIIHEEELNNDEDIYQTHTRATTQFPMSHYAISPYPVIRSSAHVFSTRYFTILLLLGLLTNLGSRGPVPNISTPPDKSFSGTRDGHGWANIQDELGVSWGRVIVDNVSHLFCPAVYISSDVPIVAIEWGFVANVSCQLAVIVGKRQYGRRLPTPLRILTQSRTGRSNS